ncbi:MAG: glycosyltransferase [Pseudomonadota bacterium]
MKLVVVAPNVSENMSGEAIKVYMYLKYLASTDVDVEAIVHERSRSHLTRLPKSIKFHIIEDDFLQKFSWWSRILRPTIHLQFFVKIRRLIKQLHQQDPDTYFQYMVPVSPIQLRAPVAGAKCILGPVTGNIFYPEAMRSIEPSGLRRMRFMRRVFDVIARLFADKAQFTMILNSGGERTHQSLIAGGAHADRIRAVFDSGVSDQIISRPPAVMQGENHKFFCSGRFDHHKSLDLAIRAVAVADPRVTLDIYGKGEMEADWRKLVEGLGLGHRVQFKGWLPSHDDLVEKMFDYRGFVFPSLAEANGIVVQEALSVGVPVICMNHGGPSMLTTSDTAVQVEPGPPEEVVASIAAAMNKLGGDPAYAEQIASAGATSAREQFAWSAISSQWLTAMGATGLAQAASTASIDQG